MVLGFKKAKREQIWLKILLAGPSGSGKTYSALRVATGIAQKQNSKIAVIDTENGRIRYYANEFDFDDLQLSQPFTPEKYIEAIDIAVDNGYKILVLDSISHEWEYCLEVHSKMPGNSYTNWSKITPRHDAFMEKVLQSALHVVATVRGKDEYVLEEKNGKQVPKKVGKGYKQRDNTEYNYTVTFNIDQQNHIAEATKDNTHIFEGKYEMLTERDGVALYDWANTGDKPEPKPTQQNNSPSTDPSPEDRLTNAIGAIDKLAKQLVENGIDKKKIGETVKEHHKNANYNGIKEIEIATKVYKALENLGKEMEDNKNE